MLEYRPKKVPALDAMPASMVLIHDGFWTPRLEVNRTVSLFHQYDFLVESGVLENFQKAGRKMKTGADFRGLFFADSDAYKWLEAASLSMINDPDPRLAALINGVIDLISAAQEESGYINTYFQLVEPDKKFTNFGVCHELYTAGHLIQAAVAHFTAFGTKSFLNIACRLADDLVEVFGPGKLETVDGHAEIEMALVSLYRTTGWERYLELALFFINQRGNSQSHLRWELAHLERIAGKLGKPG
ncbi:MAG TPA: glycoside hydrolase family 127 protein, partial [Firmicutes bacterium]|nr:glycoside hydrolase family 127 protein [Bacillota bacterium]